MEHKELLRQALLAQVNHNITLNGGTLNRKRKAENQLRKPNGLTLKRSKTSEEGKNGGQKNLALPENSKKAIIIALPDNWGHIDILVEGKVITVLRSTLQVPEVKKINSSFGLL